MTPLDAALFGIFLTSLFGIMVTVFDSQENGLVMLFFSLVFSAGLFALIRLSA